MHSTHHFRPALGAVLIAAALQTGCSSLPSMPWSGDGDDGQAAAAGGKQIEVRSDPAGAEVLANGRRIGITPVTITPGNIWTTGFVAAKDYGINYQYTGNIAIRMPGCKEFATNVDDYFLSKDIAVKLECGPDYQPVSATPAPTAAPAGPSPAGQADYLTSEEIMASRLRRLQGLRDRGAISEEEYRQVRQRILGEL